jgi:hypothetical protein
MYCKKEPLESVHWHLNLWNPKIYLTITTSLAYSLFINSSCLQWCFQFLIIYSLTLLQKIFKKLPPFIRIIQDRKIPFIISLVVKISANFPLLTLVLFFGNLSPRISDRSQICINLKKLLSLTYFPFNTDSAIIGYALLYLFYVQGILFSNVENCFVKQL